MTFEAQGRLRRSGRRRIERDGDAPGHSRWNWMSFLPAGLSRLWLIVLTVVWTIRSIRLNRLSWSSECTRTKSRETTT